MFFLNSKNTGSESGGAKKSAGKKKKDRDDAADLLEQYCSSPSDSTDLIFYCFGYDADKRTKEYKILDAHNGHSVIHLHVGNMNAVELTALVDKTLQAKHYHLTQDARAELLLRIAGQTTDFYRAMDKLELYGEKNLTLNDIEHLVSVSSSVNLWKFSDCFGNGDAAGCLRSLQEMTEIEGLPYQNVISLLAGRLRTMYNVLCLYECNVHKDEIARRTGRRFPDMDIRAAHGKGSRTFLGWLNELAELDQGIKTGMVNDREGFESFLLRNL